MPSCFGGSNIFADAASSNNFELALLLLFNGGDPNTTFPVGLYEKRPIMFNIIRSYISSGNYSGSDDFISAMIKKGADVKCTCVDSELGISNMNLLMYVADMFDTNLFPKAIKNMKFLIANGLNPNYTVYSSKLKKNVTALDIAIYKNHNGTVSFLMPLTKN